MATVRGARLRWSNYNAGSPWRIDWGWTTLLFQENCWCSCGLVCFLCFLVLCSLFSRGSSFVLLTSAILNPCSVLVLCFWIFALCSSLFLNLLLSRCFHLSFGRLGAPKKITAQVSLLNGTFFCQRKTTATQGNSTLSIDGHGDSDRAIGIL